MGRLYRQEKAASCQLEHGIKEQTIWRFGCEKASTTQLRSPSYMVVEV